MTLTLYELYQKLLQVMGPQGWWPADSKTEIILGAILVQNTNWRNVERSLQGLGEQTAFLPQQVEALSLEQLQQLIRPSGFFQGKSRAIHTLFHWLKSYQFDFERLAEKDHFFLRKELLQLPGIGPETADVLLLYVFNKKVFIADSYARRMFTYLGVGPFRTYSQLAHLVQLPASFSLADAQEFHGLIDEFGKQFVQDAQAWSRGFLTDDRLSLPR